MHLRSIQRAIRYAALGWVVVLSSACGPLAELVAGETIDENMKLNEESRREAAQSQSKLPIRFDWHCQPSSAKELSCQVASKDTWRLCGRVELLCPDGEHLGRFCTRLPKKGTQQVTVREFEPSVVDAQECSRIRLEWVSPAIAWETKPVVPAGPPPAERKRITARAQRAFALRELEECRPSLEKDRQAQDRAVQGRAYLAMSERCQKLHWEVRRCERMVEDFSSESNQNTKSAKYRKAIAECDALLPGREATPLGRAEVAIGMKAVLRNLRICGKHHGVEGKVVAKIRIRDTVAELLSIDRSSPEFVRCAEGAVSGVTLRLAPPLTVRYPFRLGGGGN